VIQAVRRNVVGADRFTVVSEEQGGGGAVTDHPAVQAAVNEFQGLGERVSDRRAGGCQARTTCCAPSLARALPGLIRSGGQAFAAKPGGEFAYLPRRESCLIEDSGDRGFGADRHDMCTGQSRYFGKFGNDLAAELLALGPNVIGPCGR